MSPLPQIPRRVLAVLLLLVFCVGASGGIVWYLRPSRRKVRFFESGKRFEQQHKTTEAAIQFLNAINLDPFYTEAHYELAKVAYQVGDQYTAFFEFQQVTEQQPNNLDAQIKLGTLLLQRNQPEKAAERGKIVLQRDPSNPDGHLILANVAIVQNELNVARSEAALALQNSKDQPEPYQVMGAINLKSGKLADAEASFKQALQVAPANLDTLLDLGNLCRTQRRWEEAEDYYRQAMKASPQSLKPRAELIMSYMEQRQPQKAEELAAQTKADLAAQPAAYRVLADYYLLTGQKAKAAQEFADLVKAHPRDWSLKQNYVQILINQGQIEEASKLNKELLLLQANSVTNLLQQSQVQISSNHIDEAITTIKKALRMDPNNYLAHHYLGVALSVSGDMEGAEREWREAAGLQPGEVGAQIALFELAEGKHDVDLLEGSSQRLVELLPYTAAAYVLRSEAEFARKRPEAGEAMLKKAMDIEPGNPVPYDRLAEVRLSQKRFPEAESLFQRALELRPSFFPALKGLVRMSLMQKQPAKAAQLVDACISRSPDNSAYFTLRGQLKLQQKDLTGAETDFQKALQLDNRNSLAWQLLGDAQTQQGSVDKAFATYQAWSAAAPDSAQPFVLLGVITDQRGDWKTAQDFYRKALHFDARNPIAANNLSYSLLEHGGNPSEALSLALAARRSDTNTDAAADTLGWAYYQNEQYEKAEGVLAQAVKVFPNDPAVHYHLGLTYLKLIEPDLGKQHLQKAIELDPKYVHGDEIRLTLIKLKRPSEADRTVRNPLRPDSQ